MCFDAIYCCSGDSTAAVVAALLAAGASASTKNTSGRTALHLAVCGI
jgi:ankyrin repeat protein